MGLMASMQKRLTKPVVVQLFNQFHLFIGCQFRSSLKPAPEAQFDLQIKDFCLRVHLKEFFADQPQDPHFNPGLYVPNVGT